MLGIDIDIHKENRKAVERHPLSKRIHMLEGSSISSEIIRYVQRIARDKKKYL